MRPPSAGQAGQAGQAGPDPGARPGPWRRLRSRSWPAGAVVGLVLAVALTAATATGLTLAPPAPGPAAVAVPLPSPAPGPVARPAPPGTGAGPAAAPMRATAVRIPALALSSELVDLGLDAVGALEPPATADVAGWFTGGALPGDPGPTVIAGHVDSRAGPGVFSTLGEVPVGAEVEVDRSDGGSARYRVVDVQVVAKESFPTARVYGPTPGPELRLITCGGEFDRGARRYLRNVVVSAVLVGQ